MKRWCVSRKVRLFRHLGSQQTQHTAAPIVQQYRGRVTLTVGLRAVSDAKQNRVYLTHASCLALMHLYGAFRLAGSQRYQSSSCILGYAIVCVGFVGMRTLTDSGMK